MLLLFRSNIFAFMERLAEYGWKPHRAHNLSRWGYIESYIYSNNYIELWITPLEPLLRGWMMETSSNLSAHKNLSWVFIKGGCSRRGVQWIGVLSCNKTAYHIMWTTTPCFHGTPLWWILISWASMDWCSYAWNTEGYGFIEFEISNSTISTVLRQALIHMGIWLQFH